MQIVSERVMAPRPLQRPSDIERRPIDFGIEPNPPQPQKPEATIIKSAISREPDPAVEPPEVNSSTVIPMESNDSAVDDWGDGIL